MSTGTDGEPPAEPDAPGAPDAPAPAPASPPPRPSQLELGAPLSYPDDGPVSRVVRWIDTWLGRIAQVGLVLTLAAVVLTAAGEVLLHHLADVKLEHKDQVVRAGTFGIALFGAAFASHQARHLSMDLVSRRISPRARLYLKVILGLFTIAIMVIVIRSGFRLLETIGKEKHEDVLLSKETIAYFLPASGIQIILFTLLHMVIDIEYLVRGKLPPERMRSAH